MVKCQILQECFLQNFNMQKFQSMEHSNSRTFKGLKFFSKFKDFQRLLKDPMNSAFIIFSVRNLQLSNGKIATSCSA